MHTFAYQPVTIFPTRPINILAVSLLLSLLQDTSSLSLNVRRTRLSTVGDRAFPVAAGRTCNSLSQHCHVHTLSLYIYIQLYSPYMMVEKTISLFSEVASRLSSSGVHSHGFYYFCSAGAVTVVIFGHLNCSFY